MSHNNVRLAVSAAVNFRNNCKDRASVFAVDAPRGESLFTVISVRATRGRPKADEIKGFGVKTKVRVQNVRTGAVKTVALSSLVDRGLRYVGKKQFLFT